MIMGRDMMTIILRAAKLELKEAGDASGSMYGEFRCSRPSIAANDGADLPRMALASIIVLKHRSSP